MKKIILMISISVFSFNSLALSQDDISSVNYPEAFNISTCVKASYYVDDLIFKDSVYKTGGKFRFAMFEKLGKGKYAPNGKYVVANYNTYESTMGKTDASKYLWETFECNKILKDF